MQDRSMWRRLLRLVHPDGSGDHDLFIWTQALYEHVAGDTLEDERSSYERRQPPTHPGAGSHSERVDFTRAFNEHGSFSDLTAHAVGMADEVGEPYARLLVMLASCYPASEADTTLYRAQHVGGSYRQAAYVAHLAGMSGSQRTAWYRLCERVPLSQAHLGHLIKELQARAA
jgi:hypothetical protein